MTPRLAFSDEQWSRVETVIAGLTLRGPSGRDDRAFIEAVIWIGGTGAPWRDVPEFFGKWSSIYRRFRRWSLAGRWEAIRTAVGDPAPVELALIDSIIIKAHAHAAGAPRSGSGQALGRSRGGFTTKLHALVSERGDRLRYMITAGQVNDITQAENLVEGSSARALVGDRAYDSDAFVAHVEALGMEAVIPSRARRKLPRKLDEDTYRARNVIERFFGRLKQLRRVAARYDKTVSSYAGFVAMASFVVMLSGWKA